MEIEDSYLAGTLAAKGWRVVPTPGGRYRIEADANRVRAAVAAWGLLSPAQQRDACARALPTTPPPAPVRKATVTAPGGILIRKSYDRYLR